VRNSLRDGHSAALGVAVPPLGYEHHKPTMLLRSHLCWAWQVAGMCGHRRARVRASETAAGRQPMNGNAEMGSSQCCACLLWLCGTKRGFFSNDKYPECGRWVNNTQSKQIRSSWAAVLRCEAFYFADALSVRLL